MSECELADLTEIVNFFYLFKPVGEEEISESEIFNAKLARAGEEAGFKTRIVLWNRPAGLSPEEWKTFTLRCRPSESQMKALTFQEGADEHFGVAVADGGHAISDCLPLSVDKNGSPSWPLFIDRASFTSNDIMVAEQVSFRPRTTGRIALEFAHRAFAGLKYRNASVEEVSYDVSLPGST